MRNSTLLEERSRGWIFHATVSTLIRKLICSPCRYIRRRERLCVYFLESGKAQAIIEGVEGERVEFLNVNRSMVVHDGFPRWKTRSVHANGRGGLLVGGSPHLSSLSLLLFFLRSVATNFLSSFCSRWTPPGNARHFHCRLPRRTMQRCRCSCRGGNKFLMSH